MICFGLARQLHQPVHEVQNWPVNDILDWCAFFELTNTET